MVKAVCFDVGGTLIKAIPEIDRAFYNEATSRGYEVDLPSCTKYMAEAFEMYEQRYIEDGDFWCNEEDAVGMYIDMYKLMAARFGIEGSHATELAYAIDAYYDTAEAWCPFEGAETCLHELRNAGYKLAVVSNWSCNLSRLLHDVGLGSYFDFILASAAVGMRKPFPDIFETACAALEVEPTEALHIGDHLDADGRGAKEAGLTPVIVDRSGTLSNECAAEGFARVRSLTELPALVKGLA